METQTCNRCLIPKPLDDFYLNPSKQSHRKMCKQCFKDADTEWRRTHRKQASARTMKWWYANPEKAKEINARNYRKQNGYRDEIMTSIFNGHPCLVCGEKRHGCLTFHHLDPNEKESGVTSHSLTWRKMLLEAAKCVVLCRNCHGLYHCGDITLPDIMTPIDASKYQLK